jgi:hypothetical protein
MWVFVPFVNFLEVPSKILITQQLEYPIFLLL